MADLKEIKIQLKKWENDLYLSEGRKPTKSDIDKAPQEIKEAYKAYGTLKRKAAEKGGNNANVWGSHLNKKSDQNQLDLVQESENGTEIAKDGSSGSISFSNSLREKLLEKAMGSSSQSLQKCYSSPRLNSSQRKSSCNSSSRFSASKTCNSQLLDSEKCKFSPNICSRKNDDSDEEPMEIKSSIFQKALKVTKKASLNASILSEGDRKPDAMMSLLERRKADTVKLQGKYKAISKDQALQFDDNQQETSTQSSDNVDKNLCENGRPFGMFSSEEKNVANDNFRSPDGQVNDNTCDKEEKDSTNWPHTVKTSDAANKKKIIKTSIFSSETSEKLNSLCDFNNAVTRQGSLSNITKKGVKRKELASEDTPRVPKKRNVLKASPVMCDEREDSNSMMEVSWRPSSRQEELMIDLDSSVHNQIDSENESDDNQEDIQIQIANTGAKARKTSAPKMTNENYVRLNMKAKRYKGKGRHMTGAAHRRMAWKQKMKARSESFGSSKCFKCGQEGHWAKHCKGPKKQQSGLTVGSVEDNTVNDADFPTMSQAYNMARGITRKKPNKQNFAKIDPVEGDSVTDAPDGTAIDSDDEELYIVRSGYEPAPPPPSVEPYYTLEDNQPLPEPTPEVFSALNKFGFTSFREGQQKAIMRVLCGKSTLVVLSTGAGKSLCYQLPAYVYAQRSKSITLVISPLVSLMEDQVQGLPAGVKGACLHTNMSPAQREKVVDAVAEGNVHFLLISPEAMAGGKSGGSLPGMNKLPPIAFACIDEAHCLSEWSHHFRPSYLRICKILKEKFGVRCILGLTATATMVTAFSVAQHIGIHDYQEATIRGSPVPSNLMLSVSRDEDKDEALITLLKGERFAECDSIIIYCTRREQTDRIATLIRTCMKDYKGGKEKKQGEESEKKKKTKGRKGGKIRDPWDAECYHAGLTAAKRKSVQNAFMCGRLRVVVATVAFGMGLDKPDVRAVIHHNLPKSFESYVQEIGRAGRDGKPAQCHMFLDPQEQDMNELKRHIYSNSVDRHVLKKLVRRLFPWCRCKEIHDKQSAALKELDPNMGDIGTALDEKSPDKRPVHRICPGHERAVSIEGLVQTLDMKEEGIATLLCYLELHPKHWIENLQNVYGRCSIQCYGGPRQLQEVAKKCPPVAVAIAKEKKLGVSHTKTSKLEFPVVEISDSMGWDSGPVKHELKLLQWNQDPTGEKFPTKTGVMVELSDLSFHLRSAGDLSSEEVDEIVEFLFERIETQERTELFHLQSFSETLQRVSHKNIWMCSEAVDMDRSNNLKTKILEYFERKPDIDQDKITKLSFSREISVKHAPLINDKITCENADFLRGDVRSFIQLYASEHQLTGRAIARIFHGIPSPCFPAEVWGRVYRFWRSHLNTDFNVLRKIATQELIGMR